MTRKSHVCTKISMHLSLAKNMRYCTKYIPRRTLQIAPTSPLAHTHYLDVRTNKSCIYWSISPTILPSHYTFSQKYSTWLVNLIPGQTQLAMFHVSHSASLLCVTSIYTTPGHTTPIPTYTIHRHTLDTSMAKTYTALLTILKVMRSTTYTHDGWFWSLGNWINLSPLHSIIQTERVL